MSSDGTWAGAAPALGSGTAGAHLPSRMGDGGVIGQVVCRVISVPTRARVRSELLGKVWGWGRCSPDPLCAVPAWPPVILWAPLPRARLVWSWLCCPLPVSVQGQAHPGLHPPPPRWLLSRLDADVRCLSGCHPHGSEARPARAALVTCCPYRARPSGCAFGQGLGSCPGLSCGAGWGCFPALRPQAATPAGGPSHASLSLSTTPARWVTLCGSLTTSTW